MVLKAWGWFPVPKLELAVIYTISSQELKIPLWMFNGDQILDPRTVRCALSGRSERPIVRGWLQTRAWVEGSAALPARHPPRPGGKNRSPRCTCLPPPGPSGRCRTNPELFSGGLRVPEPKDVFLCSLL